MYVIDLAENFDGSIIISHLLPIHVVHCVVSYIGLHIYISYVSDVHVTMYNQLIKKHA